MLGVYTLTEWSVSDINNNMPRKGQRSKAGERTRSAILKAAILILGRDGPDRLSASTLAKESGVSKATLFHHFRTFEEIPMVAMEHFWMQSLAPAAGIPKSLHAYLMQLGRPALDLPRKRATFLKAHFVFLVKAMFEPRLHVQLQEGTKTMHRQLADELSARIPKRRKAATIETATRMIEMMLDGLMLAIAAEGNTQGRVLSRQAWARFVKLLLWELSV